MVFENLSWCAYDAFGKATTSLNNTVESNLRFPGQYYDSETGLHYSLYRYYDPSAGRFLSEDPIGVAADINLYRYCFNDPVNWYDNLGLYAIVKIKKGNEVSIIIPIRFKGRGAKKAVVDKFRHGIETEWSGKFGKYKVKTTVVDNCDKTKTRVNEIEVPIGNGRAYVIGTDEGTWPSDRPEWTAAHEAGHLMNLDDRYSDEGGTYPGYENDIMGARDAHPNEADITDIINSWK